MSEMPKARPTGTSAKARMVLPSQATTRHARMHHLVREGRTSPFLAPMIFAGPIRQVHGTHPRPVNAQLYTRV